MSYEKIDHPKHYHPGIYEVIKVLEAWGLLESFSLANAVKYISRHARKGGLEDLKKARWYLDFEISRREDAHSLMMAVADISHRKSKREKPYRDKGHKGGPSVD